jgi:hypothetical protein
MLHKRILDEFVDIKITNRGCYYHLATRHFLKMSNQHDSRILFQVFNGVRTEDRSETMVDEGRLVDVACNAIIVHASPLGFAQPRRRQIDPDGSIADLGIN